MDNFQQSFRVPALVVSPDAASMVAGCFAFGSTLAISTLTQGKLLGVSTGSIRPIPSVLGMVTVCVASLVSHRASIVIHHLAASSTDSGKKKRKPFRSKSDTLLSIGDFQVSKQTVRICALGLLSFKLLGGRFWAIAPSSYTHVGSFARRSISATDQYATQAQRSTLMRIGRQCGCHTCGTRFRFGKTLLIADHQPPKSVVRQLHNNCWWRKALGVQPQFRFYPQCLGCSQVQGSILSAATRQTLSGSWWKNPTTNLAHSGGGSVAYCHGFKFRWNHLVGGIVAAFTVVGATENDIFQGNPRRFQKLDEIIRTPHDALVLR